MTTMNATQPPAMAGGPYVLAPAVLADIRLQADRLHAAARIQLACNLSEIKGAQDRINSLNQRLIRLEAARLPLMTALGAANDKRDAIYALAATLGRAAS